MSNVQLRTYFFVDEQLHAPHYQEGRLLSSGDLLAEQGMTLLRLREIGHAVGEGVTEGLWVSHDPVGPQLKIAPGIGFNRMGELIYLPKEVPISITVKPSGEGYLLRWATADDQANFTIDPFNSLKSGLYLLVIRPIYKYEGKIQLKRMIVNKGLEEDCDYRWDREGIEIRAIALEPYNPALALPATNPNPHILRNQAAHWLYNSQKHTDVLRTPFTSSLPNRFEIMRDPTNKEFTKRDLPLAVVYLNQTGNIGFVDNWAARRSPAQDLPSLGLTTVSGSATTVPSAWGSLISDRRAATGQARFLQFQEQLDALPANRANLRVGDYFRYLPPAGFIPLAQSTTIVSSLADYAINLVMAALAPYLREAVPLKTYEDFRLPDLVGINSVNHVTRTQLGLTFGKIEALQNYFNTLLRILGAPPIAVISLPVDFQSSPYAHVLINEINPARVNDLNAIQINIQRALQTYTPELVPLINVEAVVEDPDFPNLGHILCAEFNAKIIAKFNGFLRVACELMTTLWLTASHNQGANLDAARQEIVSKWSIANRLPFDFDTSGFVLDSFFSTFACVPNRTVNIRPLRIRFMDQAAALQMLQSSWNAPAIDFCQGDRIDIFLPAEETVLPILADLIVSISDKQLQLWSFLGLQEAEFTTRWNEIRSELQDYLNTDANSLLANRPTVKIKLYAMFARSVQPPVWSPWQTGGSGLG